MFQHEIVDVTQDDYPFKVILHKNNTTFIRRHWHRSFEISYTAQGQIKEFIINGHAYNPKAGDILVVNPNEIHSVQAGIDPGKDNQALSILLPYSFMEETIPNYSYRIYSIPNIFDMSKEQQDDYFSLQQAFTNIVTAMQTGDPLAVIRIRALVYQILYLLTRSFAQIKTTKNDLYTKETEFDWIDNVLIYIRRHLADSLTVPKIAEVFHLNDSYFSRKFKKYMDMSVMDYVNELRLQQAFQLLTNSSTSVQAIADQCGFPNHKSLISIFKKRYHMTPRAYRKQLADSQKSTKK